MKKVLAVVLVAVMALSLVACGSKKDYTGDWTATEVMGMQMSELEELYEAMGMDKSMAQVTLSAKKDSITITAGGEESSAFAISATDTGFTGDDDGQTVTGTYNADADTLTIEESGQKMVFKRK